MKPLKLPKKTIIEVIGNVASGKTTLARRISKVSNLKYIDTDLFENNPFMIPSVEDPKRWVFTEEVYFDFLRAKQISNVLRKIDISPIVLDQGFHMPFYMYTENRFRQKHMTKDEWLFSKDLHFSLLKDAPYPNIVIYLSLPIPELLKRMDARGKSDSREHEKLYTKAYLEQLNIGLFKYVEMMKKNKKCKTVIVYDFITNKFKTYGEKNDKIVSTLKTLLSR